MTKPGSEEKKQNDGSPALNAVKDQFIEGAGRISVSLLGMLNKVCGQIYALLFLSAEPLSLDDIVDELKVSKGNVSINIRILEDYKLVRKIWVKGSRRDYYSAVTDLPQKIIKEFFDKIRRNIQDSLDMIQDCHAMAIDAEKAPDVHRREGANFIAERLSLIRSFYENANLLFEAIYAGHPIDTSLMKPILHGVLTSLPPAKDNE